MTSTGKVLERAARIVERGWTRGALARAKDGHLVSVSSPSAARFCIRGAIYRAADELNEDHFPAMMALAAHFGGQSAIHFNDSQCRSGKHCARCLREVAAEAAS